LAAVASLSTNEKLMKQIVPPGQSFQTDYAGQLSGTVVRVTVHRETDVYFQSQSRLSVGLQILTINLTINR